jgi:tRNA-specific 2-thiouridylase
MTADGFLPPVAKPPAIPYRKRMKTAPDALALFSGGLDSILAAKTLEAQGLRVLCLHFVSPFFGHPGRLEHWRERHDLSIVSVDVGQAFVDLLLDGPVHGLGKILNPCVDCKILLLSRARELLPAYGARFLASGEVVGQRPMSQRRDALNVISREAGVRGLLLRPLSAKSLPPTPMEEGGLVDRERLHAFSGRGRNNQLGLAAQLGVRDIPTPAGGCLLTEKESAKRYWPLLATLPRPRPEDFSLANVGRQFWSGARWLVVGRNQADNEALERLAAPGDMLFKVADYPGPLGLARPRAGVEWDAAAVRAAAAVVAGFSPKARRTGGPVAVAVTLNGTRGTVPVEPIGPARSADRVFAEPDWEAARAWKKAVREG